MAAAVAVAVTMVPIRTEPVAVAVALVAVERRLVGKVVSVLAAVLVCSL